MQFAEKMAEAAEKFSKFPLYKTDYLCYNENVKGH